MYEPRSTWTDDPFDGWDGCDFGRWCFGKGGGSAPAPPDPTATANAQAAANAETARLQGVINHPNVTTPLGSQTWSQNGDQWTGNITLSPEQQGIYNSQTQAQQGLFNLANAQIPRVGQTMSSGLDLSGLADPNAQYGDIAAASRATGDQIYQAGVTRLQPQFQQQMEDTRQDLANRGIPIGSDAYGNTMRTAQQTQQDALAQLAANAQAASSNQLAQNVSTGLNLRSAGTQERAYQRSLPLNDVSALLGQSGGVQMPQFQAIAPTQVAPTDVIGPTYNSYNGQLQAYNANQRNNAALTQGLFGLAQTAIPFLL